MYQPRTQHQTDPRVPRETPPPPLPPRPRYHEREPTPRQMTPPRPSQPPPEASLSPIKHPPTRENNFGDVVNTFTTFLHNLNQQTGQLLSSLNQLNYLQRRLLKPIVKEQSHILSNSSELINDLHGINCSNNTLLASLDITSLYPNIPIQESISIILNFIEKQNNPPSISLTPYSILY